MSAGSAIPRYPSDVTAAWLTDVLGRRGTVADVASVDVRPVGTGQTGATFRVSAGYATNPHGLPDSFILKLPSGDDAVRVGDAVLGHEHADAGVVALRDRREPVAPLRWASYTQLAADPAVAWSVPLSLGDSHRGFPVLGTNADYFRHYRHGAREALRFSAGEPFAELFETVLGAEVAARLGYRVGDTLTLNEHFVYDDGEKQQRVWHIRRVGNDRYEGTAGDIEGVATGQAAGNAFNWHYSMNVKANGSTSTKVFKGAELDVDGTAVVRRSISFAQHSTRRHYPGAHRVDALINGRAQQIGVVQVQPPVGSPA